MVRVGTGPLSLLGVAFVVLKLTDNIDWSWLWVLAPFWIPWAIVLFILVFFGIGVLIVALLDSHDDRKRRKLKQERLKQQSLRR